MVQVKVSLGDVQLDFLNRYHAYGFKDKSAVVRAALNRLRAELEQQRLRESAELYAEVYEEDQDTQALTESALTEWPS